MLNEDITKNEVLNDGKTIHLYFNSMVGLYVAYGVSAYLLCKHAHARPSYSEEMQMPAAVINAGHYEELKKQIGLSKTIRNHRRLIVKDAADMDEYSEWASQLRVKETDA